jgi:CheY-like chemotaxis protein
VAGALPFIGGRCSRQPETRITDFGTMPNATPTMYNNDDYRQRAVDAGIAGFVTKPFTLDHLRHALQMLPQPGQGATGTDQGDAVASR